MTDDPGPSWLSRILGRADTTAPLDALSAAARTRMLSAAENFHELKVHDVMVPRADIIAVDTSTGLHDLAKAFKEAGHSRLPVFKETLDDPLGMVHIKDVLPYLMLDAKGRTGKRYPDRKVIQYIRRPVLFVPPSMLAQDLLRKMQARRMHMAVVVDEYGGTDGLCTIEDLIEPIVGDIDDEHDNSDAQIKRIAGTGQDTVWEADARVNIDNFEELLGWDFATPDEEEDVDTLGGLVFTLAGRVPDRGEIIYHPDGLEFEVVDADPRRVKTLRIQATRTADETAPSTEISESQTSSETGSESSGDNDEKQAAE